MIIRKGKDRFEAKEKVRDYDIERARAVQDYNIMIGNLDDPNEGDDEDE